MNLEKMNSETEFEYGLRIIEGKVDRNIDLDWDEVCDLLKLDCHKDSLRKATSVTPYNGVAVAKYYKDKIEEMIANGTHDSQSYIDECENKRVELFKERVRYQDVMNNYRKLQRTEARWENVLSLINNAILNLDNIDVKQNCKYEPNTNAKASLILSDWHIGSEINTEHNTFNVEVAKERISKLVKDTVEYCNVHKVDELNLDICGDLVSGTIHITTRLLNQIDVVEQTVLCSELLTQMISELATEIPNIKINYTIGNHGRIANIKESLDTENFEYFILEFIKLRLKDVKNVTFNSTKVDKEIVLYDVFDRKIALVHGHREKNMFNSVKELSLFLGEKITDVHMGHFHNFSYKNNVIVNGCLSGSDEYANNLRFNNDPSQVLAIYFENGSKCLYEIVLN